LVRTLEPGSSLSLPSEDSKNGLLFSFRSRIQCMGSCVAAPPNRRAGRPRIGRGRAGGAAPAPPNRPRAPQSAARPPIGRGWAGGTRRHKYGRNTMGNPAVYTVYYTLYSAARCGRLGGAQRPIGGRATADWGAHRTQGLTHSIVDQIVKSSPVLESSGGRLNDEPGSRVEAK
jgi:hypothetical protein